jgi:hypothetical protein
MSKGGRWTLAVPLLAGLVLGGCSPSSGPAAKEPAVAVEKNAETGLSRLTLTAKAAERLGIATASIIDQQIGSTRRSVVPYAAVIYDASGQTWTYTNAGGLVFVRQAITVERIDADLAVLSAGPPIGTLVVIVGVAELWGIETGVGGGH